MSAPGSRATDAALEHVREVVVRALDDLRRRSGLDSWMLAHRDGDQQVVLHAVGAALAAPGTPVPWAETFCALRAEAGAPSVAGDVSQVPAYASLAARRTPEVRAVVTVPVVSPDGELVGDLCGLGTHAVPDLEQHREAVELQAALIGSLMAFERHVMRDRRRAEQAERAARTDPLTGLGNRRTWDDAVESEDARAAVLGTPVGVVVADLDGLKHLNDADGHAAGDAALRAAADALQAVAAAEHLAARLGGDELGLLLPEADAARTAEVVERLRAAWHDAGVDVSVGWAVRDAGRGLRDAWRVADAAMYADKGRRSAAARRAAPAVPRAPEGRAPRLGNHEPVVRALRTDPRGGTAGDVDALLELVTAQLGLDVAYVNERRDDHWRIRNVHADPTTDLEPGDLSETTNSYCELLVTRQIPAAVQDSHDVPALAALPATDDLAITAYVGTPLHRSDGSLYGTLCAYAHDAEPALGDRDAGVLRVVGGLVMSIVEQHDREDRLRHDLLERLDGLAAAGGPRMVFQPVVALADGSVVGHEALSRFPTGDPAEWFATARSAGLEEDLELTAVRSALARLDDVPGFLAVNVSARTAGLPALGRVVGGCDPARVVLELTEHTPVDDYAALRRTLAPLRRAGVRIAVDDVGAGFASMRHVLELVPDVLKLDISLVRNIATDSSRQALAASMLAFADKTGAQVVAEGIETADELDYLRTMGVGLGQGYHLGRPAPLAA